MKFFFCWFVVVVPSSTSFSDESDDVGSWLIHEIDDVYIQPTLFKKLY